MSHVQKSHSFPKKQRRDFAGPRDHGSNRPRPSFGDRPPFRPGARGGGLELTRVTCAKCGKQTEVPFKPTGDKPVYCRDCFRQNSSYDGARPARGESRARFEGRSDERSESRAPSRDRYAPKDPASYAEEFERINRKLDKIIEALEIEE